MFEPEGQALCLCCRRSVLRIIRNTLTHDLVTEHRQTVENIIQALSPRQVGVRNDPVSKSKLISLIAEGGYNIHRHFQDNSWTDGADYFVEMKIVCETKDLAHALELKRTIEKAYPCTSTFENEPLNDKRTCPCYIKKVTKI